MKYLLFFRPAFVHILAVLLFLALAIGFFYPMYFQEKKIQQHDIRQHRGAVKNIATYNQKIENKQNPARWNTHIFSGMPAYVEGISFPQPILQAFHGLYTLRLKHPVWTLFSAMLSCYIFLLALRVRPSISMLFAISYALSSYAVIGLGAGHNARIGAMAYIPLIMAGVALATRYYQKNTNKNLWLCLAVLLCVLGVAFQLKSNHIQITYYTAMAVGIYFIAEVVRQIINPHRTWRLFAVAWSALLMAALIGFYTYYGRFSLMYTYSQHSIRGEKTLLENKKNTPSTNSKEGLNYDYAFAYSNDIFEPLTLLVPRIYGGASAEALPANSASATQMRRLGVPEAQAKAMLQRMPTYLGSQPLTSPYYAGVWVIFMFVWGSFLLRRRQKYVWWIIGAVALMITWGKHFPLLNDALFYYLPAFNKFRSHTFAIILVIFSMIAIGAQGMEKGWRKRGEKETMKMLLRSFYVLGAILGICFVASFFISYQSPVHMRLGWPAELLSALQKDTAGLLRGDIGRTLLFLILIGGGIFLYHRAKLPWSYAWIGLLAISLIDLIGVDIRYFSHARLFERSRQAYTFRPWAVDKRIRQDTSAHYRVLTLQNPFNESRTAYFHRSVGGYHAAKLRRYQDLITHVLSPEIVQIQAAIEGKTARTPRIHGLNMLNVKYFIIDETNVRASSRPYGPAWPIETLHRVGTPQEEMDGLKRLRYSYEAVIDTALFPLSFPEKSFTKEVTINIVDYKPNAIRYRVAVQKDTLGREEAFLVFSEIHYPEWKAFVNGKETPLFRANYCLRAVKLPLGTHEVSLVMHNASFLRAQKHSQRSSILWLCVIIGLGGYIGYIKYKSVRKRQNT